MASPALAFPPLDLSCQEARVERIIFHFSANAKGGAKGESVVRFICHRVRRQTFAAAHTVRERERGTGKQGIEGES